MSLNSIHELNEKSDANGDYLRDDIRLVVYLVKRINLSFCYTSEFINDVWKKLMLLVKSSGGRQSSERGQ